MANELYVKEHRIYGNAPDFLRRIYDELIRWTGKIVGQFEQVPFGYSEWTLTGHLAMAASKADFFALQDYVTQPADVLGKKTRDIRVRPDLYIGKPGDRDECVFEVKSENVGLGDKRIWNRVQNPLDRDWAKLKSYAYYEATYACALVGLTVFGDVDRWTEQCATRRQYKASCDAAYEKLKDGVKHARSKAASGEEHCKPNFYWGYFLRHKYAEREKKVAEEGNYTPVAIGMLWAGCIGKAHRP